VLDVASASLDSEDCCCLVWTLKSGCVVVGLIAEFKDGVLVEYFELVRKLWRRCPSSSSVGAGELECCEEVPNGGVYGRGVCINGCTNEPALWLLPLEYCDVPLADLA